jgi:hypothetical protein
MLLKFYITSVSIIKNYILIGDACRSSQLIVWRKRDNSLTLIAKDYDIMTSSLTTGYVVDRSTLGIVSTDDEGNLQVLRFNPR